MADDQAFIGYRSAGRRRPELNDRRASADVPVALARGALSGVLGAPGDLESLVRMLPGLSEQTVLPTSEDVERRLPLRSVSETPVGRAATGLSQLAGGFYTGPGSPLRALGALPSAVRQAGRDFVMAAGQPAVNVVKPKGGNWLAGTVERTIDPMRTLDPNMVNTLRNADPRFVDQAALSRMEAEGGAVDRWLETKLAKYIKNEMATPEDPIRALAERGVLHVQPYELGAETPIRLRVNRTAAGFPEEGMGQSEAARFWERKADTAIRRNAAGDLTESGIGSSGVEKYLEENPWLFKVPPETGVYQPFSSVVERELGFNHLADELRNAVNPASGLPENLRWKYSDLDKVSVPQAVERVAKINEWRAAQKAEADLARAMNPATQVVKEYPEQGMRWVELKEPSDLPEGYSVRRAPSGVFEVVEPDGSISVATNEAEAIRMVKGAARSRGIDPLADAIKYEGETMGHCVGRYCPDVVEGRSRIYSLRDKKGEPHVTIEVSPRPIKTWDDVTAAVGKEQAAKLWQEFDEIGGNNMSDVGAGFDMFIRNKGIEPAQEIVQIKGKANRAPNPEYLPAVQDFVRSGKWSNVGDLKNTGLIDLDEAMVPMDMRKGQRFVTEDEYKALVRRNAEDFSLGGLVQKYAEGGLVMNQANIYGSDAKQNPASAYKFADGGQAGSPPAYAEGGLVANSPTVDFDPARIDAIVGELHAMNAG
ncbi:MAG: PcfJ-like protein [Pseudomonadota bacterium]|jgi:hypothetical protein